MVDKDVKPQYPEHIDQSQGNTNDQQGLHEEEEAKENEVFHKADSGNQSSHQVMVSTDEQNNREVGKAEQYNTGIAQSSGENEYAEIMPT